MNQTDAFSKGMKMFHDGDIREAILAFKPMFKMILTIVAKDGVC